MLKLEVKDWVKS